MIQHIHTHKMEVPYGCNQFDMTFIVKEDMISHSSTHTRENIDPTISAKRDLNKHNKVCINDKPNQCNVCDKAFITKSKLERHMHIHTGEKLFESSYITHYRE